MSLPDPTTQASFYADVPLKRLLAFVIDTVIILALTAVFALMTLGLAFFVFFGLMAVVGFLYRIVTLTGNSATLGMSILSVEMRTKDGHRFDLGHAVLHTVGTYISMAVSPLQLISIVLMLMTARGQGLTDHILGSVCMNRSGRV